MVVVTVQERVNRFEQVMIFDYYQGLTITNLLRITEGLLDILKLLL